MSNRFQAFVIGASAGGLAALQTILSGLGASFSAAVLIVQHRLPSLQDYLVNLISDSTDLPVTEAEEKQTIEPRTVYIAPANYHLLIEPNRTFSLTVDPRVTFSRPSIDVLFESAADVYRETLVGTLLTGANHDGTSGMLKIKAYGGLTIAQDPATAEAPFMPASAIQAGAVDFVLDLQKIAEKMAQLEQEVTTL